MKKTKKNNMNKGDVTGGGRGRATKYNYEYSGRTGVLSPPPETA